MTTAELPAIDEPLIERVHSRIVETFDPEAIYLFGSAARGESRYGSDLDLLVVMELPQGTERPGTSVTLRPGTWVTLSHLGGW